jgi:hypothetical protein
MLTPARSASCIATSFATARSECISGAPYAHAECKATSENPETFQITLVAIPLLQGPQTDRGSQQHASSCASCLVEDAAHDLVSMTWPRARSLLQENVAGSKGTIRK